MTLFHQITEVWTPLSLAIAAVSGLILGYVLVGRFAVDPAYASGEASALEYATTTALVALASGLVFYGGQILTSYIGGDPDWTRVVSRYGIWIAYCVSIGLGLFLRLRRHVARKRMEARERAAAELAEDGPGGRS